MIAYQQTHASARSLRFLSQTPQVSHKLDAVRASINNVSCLYQVCDSAHPVAVVIYSAAANEVWRRSQLAEGTSTLRRRRT